MLLSFTEFIGRLHPLFVHLPIGILLMALLFSLLARKEQYTLSHSIMKLVWSIGSFFSVLSCITGYLLSFGGEYEEGAVNLHMWLGISVALVSVLITFKVYQRRFDILYTILCCSLLLLIAGTGHYGGSLTHGEEYLTAALYSDEDEPAASMIKPLANVQEAAVYKDVIVPILESRCYSCHGTKKQKGKLRMDTPEHLLKGGKNGEIIIPGNSTESELMKRVLLPLEDDDHMAPKGKLQLTKNQVALLKWWIDEGASFDKKVKDLAQNDKLKPILSALEGAEEKEKVPDTIWPTEPVQAADQKALDTLKAKGIVVLPVAQNSNYLMANFVTAPGVGDKDLQLLLPVKKQLIILKIGNSKISDEGMKVIGQCVQLRQLQLNNTGITDKGVAQLKELKELQSLNLVGTQVTAQGLLHLKSLPQIRTIYLYQSSVTNDQWATLKRAFPKTLLDTGGYKVPTLLSDTTVVVATKVEK